MARNPSSASCIWFIHKFPFMHHLRAESRVVTWPAIRHSMKFYQRFVACLSPSLMALFGGRGLFLTNPDKGEVLTPH